MTLKHPARRAYRRTKDEQHALEAQLVRVSLQLFSEGGHEALSMRKLAAEVGMAPMSLYRYFPSKTHLMRYIWQDVLDQACARGHEAAARARTAHTRLRAFVSGYLDHFLDYREHYHVVFAFRSPRADGADATEQPRPDLQGLLGHLHMLALDCLAHGHKVDHTSDRTAGRTPDLTADQHARQLALELHWLAAGFLLAVVGVDAATPADAQRQRERLFAAIDARMPLPAAAAKAGRVAPRRTSAA